MSLFYRSRSTAGNGVLQVNENSPLVPINIAAPSDAAFSSTQLTVTVTGLPTDGTVFLSDGVTPVTNGATLTVAQLTSLQFQAQSGVFGKSSAFSYLVKDPSGRTARGVETLKIGADTTPPTTVNGTLTVTENAAVTAINIPVPTDPNYAASQLKVTVRSLPSDGTVFLSNGVTPVRVGETLSVTQLTGLEFKPKPGVSGQTSTFTYTVTDPSRLSASGSETLAIGADTSPPVTVDPTLTVAENAAATAINIPAPTDPNYAASQLTVTVTALPTDGKVLLANGTTPVTVGETLTVAQLTGLEFQPTAGQFNQSSTFTYSVKDPAGLSASGSETLAIGADTSPPVTVDPTLTVAENAAATAINIPAPTDPNYAASQLTVTVTALPTDGTVLLANGTTSVTVGETLTVAQLTGLEFQPTAGAFSQTSTFTYSVKDPSGLSATGSETLTIGASTPAPVSAPGSTGLTAEAVQSGSAVQVTGTNNTGLNANIFIYVSPTGDPIGPGTDTGVTTIYNAPDGSWTSNLINGLAPGTYAIEAVDGNDISINATTTITVSATPTPVVPPTDSGSSGGTSTGSSGLLVAPAVPQPTQPGDVVGLILQNTQSTALSAHEITFGQVFGAGLVPAGSQLEAIINGVDTPVQMDVKTTNPDGSAASVVLTMMQPTLTPDSSTNVMLALAPAGMPAGTPVNIANLTDANYNFQVDLTLNNSDGTNTSYQIDAAQALHEALSSGTATYWLDGSQATQVRVDVPIAGSLHVTMNITDYADGTTSTEVQFNNDYAMTANGGAANYGVSILQNGQVAFQQGNINQAQYTTWDKTFYSDGAPQVNIQQDIRALENTGAIQAYDLTAGISASTIAANDASLSGGNFGLLGPGNIAQDMTGTGGRPDIGTEPLEDTEWLVTQSQGAADYALAQTEAAGSIPWHLFDPTTGTYLSLANYPTLTTNGAAIEGGGVTTLTQPIPGNTGWNIDVAHEPDVAYTAYLMTGDQYDLDQLNAEASYDVVDLNTPYYLGSLFGTGEGIVTSNLPQVRLQAWALREVVEAAFINPDGSAEKAYFTQAMNNSFDYLLNEAENSNEGQVSGWVQGTYGSNNGAMAPWQQDYFASTVVLAAEQGSQAAVQLLAWETNFLAGAFLSAANGFSPYDGAAYNLYLSSGNEQAGAYQTWAQVEAATQAAGQSYNGTWANMGGDYGALAQAALAGDITVSESPEAIEAYGWVAYNLSQTGFSISNYPQFDIVPRLSDGNYLTPANMHFSYDAAETTNTLQFGNSDQLIYAGAGNDTLIGGSGINMLFAGSGNDTLEGGASNDYVFGGGGKDILAGGAGTNFLVAGTGPDTFVFSANDAANDTVEGFKIGTDQLLIQSIAGSNLSAASIIASATTDSNNDLVLHLSAQHTIVMAGITPTQLTASMISVTQ